MPRIRWPAVIFAVFLSGCCHTCWEGPGPVQTSVPPEVPAPYRLVYQSQPSRYIPDFVVIQGGREFVLQPEIPGGVFRAMRRVVGVVFGVALLAAGPVWAQSQTPLGAIKKLQQLPITGVNIIESDKGTFFVSANGRFVFKGPLYDVWNGQPVSSMEDVENIVNRVDLKKIGVDLSQLSTFSLGKGDQEVVIFISPECPHCHKILDQAGQLADKYTFRLVIFPVGQKALALAKKVWCAGPEKSLPALRQQQYDGLPAGQCDITPMQKALVVARVLSIPSVPYLIRYDGRTHKGALNDLAGWLSEPVKEAKK